MLEEELGGSPVSNRIAAGDAGPYLRLVRSEKPRQQGKQHEPQDDIWRLHAFLRILARQRIASVYVN
jgi:hypothetical protein